MKKVYQIVLVIGLLFFLFCFNPILATNNINTNLSNNVNSNTASSNETNTNVANNNALANENNTNVANSLTDDGEYDSLAPTINNPSSNISQVSSASDSTLGLSDILSIVVIVVGVLLILLAIAILIRLKG